MLKVSRTIFAPKKKEKRKEKGLHYTAGHRFEMGDNRDESEILAETQNPNIEELEPLLNGTTSVPPALEKVPGISPDYPKTDFQFEDRFIDEFRSLRVAVIGAGMAGITASILLPRKVPGIQLTVFEKNADVAGTWYENK